MDFKLVILCVGLCGLLCAAEITESLNDENPDTTTIHIIVNTTKNYTIDSANDTDEKVFTPKNVTPEEKIKDKTVLKDEDEDEDVEYRQKRQAYTPARTKCGFDVIQDTGILHSPNYPTHYSPNTECTWRITVPVNYRVELRFQSFEIENHDNCAHDYLEIRDGHESTSPLLGRYCGSRNLADMDIRSSGNKMTVKFVSDGSVHKAGFAANFVKVIDCPIFMCIPGCYIDQEAKHCPKCVCDNGNCSYQITSPNGEIMSPNYPDYYPAKKNCTWLFTTTPGKKITLEFKDFELEPHKECSYDHIVAYDGDSDESPTLGKFCGSRKPPPIVTSGNRMYLVFKSDPAVQRKGFKATHTTVPPVDYSVSYTISDDNLPTYVRYFTLYRNLTSLTITRQQQSSESPTNYRIPNWLVRLGTIKG